MLAEYSICRAHVETLPEKKALQAGCRSDGDVGQHPQLFERLERQVLRLIDDQQRPSAATDLHLHEFLKARQQRAFRQAAGELAELFRQNCRSFASVVSPAVIEAAARSARDRGTSNSFALSSTSNGRSRLPPARHA